MTMHGDFSPEARAGAQRKARAAAVFAEHAERIVDDLPVLTTHVLVAVVDGNYSFSGSYHVETTEIVSRVPELEADGGWAMVFSSATTVEDVRRRADEMASIANQRVAAIDRILTRRAAQSEAESG